MTTEENSQKSEDAEYKKDLEGWGGTKRISLSMQVFFLHFHERTRRKSRMKGRKGEG